VGIYSKVVRSLSTCVATRNVQIPSNICYGLEFVNVNNSIHSREVVQETRGSD
jgi:hypothetical protein